MTTFSYDAAFRLTTIAVKYGTSNGPQVVLGYDAANRETSISRTIGGSGTAVNTSFSYDNANRLTTITDQTGGGTHLATYVYGYDNANRVTTEVNAEGTVTYTYDSGGELLTARGSRTENYSYDSGGNRTMTGYSTGTGNELLNSPGHTYTYDNEGNLLSDNNGTTITTYTYDYRNRLTSVKVGGTVVATYTYDALNRRIGFKDNGTQTWTVYDGQNPYADFNGSGTLLTRYVSDPGPRRDPGANLLRRHHRLVPQGPARLRARHREHVGHRDRPRGLRQLREHHERDQPEQWRSVQVHGPRV